MFLWLIGAFAHTVQNRVSMDVYTIKVYAFVPAVFKCFFQYHAARVQIRLESPNATISDWDVNVLISDSTTNKFCQLAYDLFISVRRFCIVSTRYSYLKSKICMYRWRQEPYIPREICVYLSWRPKRDQRCGLE